MIDRTALQTLELQREITAKGRENVIRMLVEIKHALMFANESPNGPINDTIWMMHQPETLMDFIDRHLEQYETGVVRIDAHQCELL